MRTKEAIEFFGGSTKALAEALCITVSAINQWGGMVPMGRREAVRYAMKTRAEQLEQEAKRLRKAAKNHG